MLYLMVIHVLFDSWIDIAVDKKWNEHTVKK